MYLHSWHQYFGHPKILRVDPDGAWKANKNLEKIENEGVYLDVIPGEAHHWISTVEESIREIKGCMFKLAAADPEITGTEAFYRAIHAVNGKDIVDGYTSLQWALGRAPDIEGRTYPASGVNLTKTLEEEGDEFDKDLKRRMTADEAAVRELYRSREARANHTKNRKIRVFSPGDLVY